MAAPSTRSPRLHYRASRADLRGMEIAVPPGPAWTASTLPAPMPVGDYETKPLPPVPSSRFSHSTKSSSSSADKCKTPKSPESLRSRTAAAEGPRNHEPSEHENQRGADGNACHVAWLLAAEKPAVPQKSPRRVHSQTQDMGTSYYRPETPPYNSPLKLQNPIPAREHTIEAEDPLDARKRLISSPSGHDPSRKIRQLTGLDVPMSSPEQKNTDALLETPVSSISGSSIYSDEIGAAVSEPDSDAYSGCFSDGGALSSRFTSWGQKSTNETASSLNTSSLFSSGSGRVCIAPARLKTSISTGQMKEEASSFGVRATHPSKSPYPEWLPVTAALQSTFDDSEDEGQRRKRKSTLDLARAFRRQSSVAEITASRLGRASPVAQETCPHSRSTTSVPSPERATFPDFLDDDTWSSPRLAPSPHIVRQTAVSSNSSRRSNSFDARFPVLMALAADNIGTAAKGALHKTGSQITGLASHARRSVALRSPMGLVTRRLANRRHDHLKNSIRIIPESGGELESREDEAVGIWKG